MPDTQDPDLAIGELFTQLDTLDLGELTEGTLADLGRRYDMLLRIIGMAKHARDALEIALVEAMPEDSLSMEDVTIIRKRSPRSAWKERDSAVRMREDIRRTVATMVATDVATGEVDPMRRNLIEHAINELWKGVPSFSSIKVEAAKSWGLRMGDYRSYTDGYTLTVITKDES